MNMPRLFWGGCVAGVLAAAGVWYLADYCQEYPESWAAQCVHAACRFGNDVNPFGRVTLYMAESTRKAMHDREDATAVHTVEDAHPDEPMEVIDLTQVEVHPWLPEPRPAGEELKDVWAPEPPAVNEEAVVTVPPGEIEESEVSKVMPGAAEESELPATMPYCDDEKEPVKAPEHVADTEELMQFIRFIQEHQGMKHADKDEVEPPVTSEEPSEVPAAEEEPKTDLEEKPGTEESSPKETEEMPESKPADCKMDPDYHHDYPACPYTGRSSHCPEACEPQMHETKKVTIPDVGCGEEAPSNLPAQVDEDEPRHREVDTMEFRKEDAKKGEFKKKPM